MFNVLHKRNYIIKTMSNNVDRINEDYEKHRRG